ncbi:MAG: cytidine deaminase [Candidatus Saccharibacteria bacterium]|nr:cytidine deaminase [Candidatus Saccharibacteria bacterium]
MDNEISNKELIKLAVDVLNPIEIEGDWIGDVGSALVTDKGNIYKGACVDDGSGVGSCAERTAIAQMFTNKEYKVKKIVAVWNNNPQKDVYVLPPCGACRLFMFSRLEDGLDADVIISSDKTVKLRELYPYHEWPERKEEL